MEGGIDMEGTVAAPPPTTEQAHAPDQAPEEGNKFQKAIGAWRSRQCLVWDLSA